MKMNYYVGARGALKVGDTMREPGDAVPEAAEWPNLAIYVHGGYLVGVPEGGAPVVVTQPVAPVAPATPPAAPDTDLPATLAEHTVAAAEPLILQVDDTDVLLRWLEAEQQGENRKGIVVPLTTKLEALTQPKA